MMAWKFLFDMIAGNIEHDLYGDALSARSRSDGNKQKSQGRETCRGSIPAHRRCPQVDGVPRVVFDR